MASHSMEEVRFFFSGGAFFVDAIFFKLKIKRFVRISKFILVFASSTTILSGLNKKLKQVAKHTTEQDCWVVVDGKVLDVTR